MEKESFEPAQIPFLVGQSVEGFSNSKLGKMLQSATHHGLGQGAGDVSTEAVVNTEAKSYLARHGPGEVDFFRVWKKRRIAVGGEETNLQGITFPDFLPAEL
jgi:hypothetical protein